jgi:hypothetical protein
MAQEYVNIHSPGITPTQVIIFVEYVQLDLSLYLEHGFAHHAHLEHIPQLKVQPHALLVLKDFLIRITDRRPVSVVDMVTKIWIQENLLLHIHQTFVFPVAQESILIPWPLLCVRPAPLDSGAIQLLETRPWCAPNVQAISKFPVLKDLLCHLFWKDFTAWWLPLEKFSHVIHLHPVQHQVMKPLFVLLVMRVSLAKDVSKGTFEPAVSASNVYLQDTAGLSLQFHQSLS